MIRTFLFDMGNVLVYFSHERMCEQIGALAGRSAAMMKRELMESGWYFAFERGDVTPEEFHRWLEATYSLQVQRSQLAHAASDIFTLNSPIVPVLDQLKNQGYRLVLLSNTSIFHYEFIRDSFDVLNRFDDFVLSYQIGALKPEPAIYEAALAKIGCDPRECFYTDDIAAYVAAGRQHGLDAEVFTTVDSLRKQLDLRGIDLT